MMPTSKAKLICVVTTLIRAQVLLFGFCTYMSCRLAVRSFSTRRNGATQMFWA